MSKIWKIVGIIVLVVIILGAICVGVGLMTNADYSRIYSVLDAEYHITDIYQVISESVTDMLETL